MYEAFYGLNEAPFSLVPDARFLYMSESHEDALMMLHYSITRNKGASLLSGDPGLGKTTLCHKLFEMLDPVQTQAVAVVNPILTPIQMLQEVLANLDLPHTSRSRQTLASDLHSYLITQYERGVRVVLVIDEAHLIRNRQTFDEIRLILNWQMEDRFLINLILMGENSVHKRLEACTALRQRLAVKVRLQPLDQIQTGEMILHRLRVAGYREDQSPFTPDAVFEIHRHAAGAPRAISQLADNALLAGYRRKLKKIDAYLTRDVIDQIDQSEAA